MMTVEYHLWSVRRFVGCSVEGVVSDFTLVITPTLRIPLILYSFIISCDFDNTHKLLRSILKSYTFRRTILVNSFFSTHIRLFTYTKSFYTWIIKDRETLCHIMRSALCNFYSQSVCSLFNVGTLSNV